MNWSRIKSLVESRFAKCVSGKVHIYSTRWKCCDCGRAWITYRKTQIANFETIPYLDRRYREREPVNSCGHIVVDDEDRVAGELIDRGEMSRFSLHEACREFLNLPIDKAVLSENPLIQGLAFLDARLGKNRAEKMRAENLHPLSRRLLEIRLSEEGQQSE